MTATPPLGSGPDSNARWRRSWTAQVGEAIGLMPNEAEERAEVVDAPQGLTNVNWKLTPVDASRAVDTEQFFSADRSRGDYLHVFDYGGQRTSQRDVGWNTWRERQAELVGKLGVSIAFFYGM